MTKQEWQNIYEELNNKYSEFLLVYSDVEKGKNATIRQNAKRKANYAMDAARYIIDSNSLIKLMAKTDKISDLAIFRGESFDTIGHFDSDMSELLREIKKKIDTEE